MYCSNCGKQIETDAKFCSNCGAPAQAKMAIPTAVEEQTPSWNACPVCRKNDRVEKVETVVRGGSRVYAVAGQVETEPQKGFFSETRPFSGQGEEMTEQARSMAFPGPPQPRKFWCSGFAFLFMIFIMVMMAIWAYYLASWTLGTWAEGGALSAKLTLLLCLVGGPGIFVLAGGVIILLRVLHTGAEHHRVEQEMPSWQAAYANWGRLYYCHRDNVVFDPETVRCCSPDQAVSLAYSLAKAGA